MLSNEWRRLWKALEYFCSVIYLGLLFHKYVWEEGFHISVTTWGIVCLLSWSGVSICFSFCFSFLLLMLSSPELKLHRPLAVDFRKIFKLPFLEILECSERHLVVPFSYLNYDHFIQAADPLWAFFVYLSEFSEKKELKNFSPSTVDNLKRWIWRTPMP